MENLLDLLPKKNMLVYVSAKGKWSTEHYGQTTGSLCHLAFQFLGDVAILVHT